MVVVYACESLSLSLFLLLSPSLCVCVRVCARAMCARNVCVRYVCKTVSVMCVIRLVELCEAVFKSRAYSHSHLHQRRAVAGLVEM